MHRAGKPGSTRGSRRTLSRLPLAAAICLAVSTTARGGMRARLSKAGKTERYSFADALPSTAPSSIAMGTASKADAHPEKNSLAGCGEELTSSSVDAVEGKGAMGKN